MEKEETKVTVETNKGFRLNVFFVGSKEDVRKHPVILTVHDLGSNHLSFSPFIYHPSMAELRKRASFLQVDILGQGENDPSLPDNFKFPSLQDLGESLVSILDAFNVSYVVGLGEGAGSNILARFAMAYPLRVMGLCLIHCTSTTAGVMEYFKDKVINWKLEGGMNPSAEEYLVLHKFGSDIEAEESDMGRQRLIQAFTESLKMNINPKNLRYFLDSFLKVDTLLVTGAKAAHLHTVYTMYEAMSKSKSSLLKISGVGNVIAEAPAKLAEGFFYFIKGIGFIPALPMPTSTRVRSGSYISMEEADKPRRYSYEMLDK